MQSILYAIASYLVLLVTVRVLSRRPGGQLTPFEFVIVFLIGGVMILCIVGNDRSETNSVLCVLSIGLAHRWLSWLKHRNPRLGLLIDGTPLVLLHDGCWRSETMEENRVQEMDVMAAARGAGIRSLADVKCAVLERNGAITVIKADKAG